MKKKAFITEVKVNRTDPRISSSKDLEVDGEEFPNRNIARLKDCVFPPMGFNSPQKLPNCHVDEKILMKNVLERLKVKKFSKMVNLLYSSKAVQEFLLDSFWLFYFSTYGDIAELVLSNREGKSLRKSKEDIRSHSDLIFRRLSINFTQFTLKMTEQYCSELKDYFMSFLTEFSSKVMYLFYFLCFPKEFLEFQSVIWKKKLVTFFNFRLYGLNNVMHKDRALLIQDEEKWMGGFDVNLNLLLRRLTTKEELKKLQIAMKMRQIRLKKLCKYLSHNEFVWDSGMNVIPEDFATEEDRLIARQQQEEDLIGPTRSSSQENISSSKSNCIGKAVLAVRQMKASPSLSLVAEEEAKWKQFVRHVFPKKHHVRKLERRLDDLDRRIILTNEPIEDQEAFLREIRGKSRGGGLTGRTSARSTTRTTAGNVSYRTPRPAPRISHELRRLESRKGGKERLHSQHPHNSNNNVITGGNTSTTNSSGTNIMDHHIPDPSYLLPLLKRQKKWFEAGTESSTKVSKRCKYVSVEKDKKFQAFSKTESPFVRNYLRHLHEEQQKGRIRKIILERQQTLYSSVPNIPFSEPKIKKKKNNNKGMVVGGGYKKRRRPKLSYSFFHSGGNLVPKLLDKESLFINRPKTTASMLMINKRKKMEESTKKKKVDKKKRKEKNRKVVPPINFLKKRNRYRLDDVL